MRNHTAPRAFKSSHSKHNSYAKQHTHTHQYSQLARILLVLWLTTINSHLYYTPTHTMSSLKLLNQDAEHAKRFVALAMNINAAKGLQEVLKTNLGPKVLTP